MGLDSFWVVPKKYSKNKKIAIKEKVADALAEEKEFALCSGGPHPKFEPELMLVGGMMTGSGCGSFRGKAYNEFIEYTTGISLYQEVMLNDNVKHIADCLAKTKYQSRWAKQDDKGWNITKQEFLDLRRMFMEYAKVGGILKGWW